MTSINQNELDSVLRDFKNDAINQNDARAKIIDLTDADDVSDLPPEGERELTAEEVGAEVKKEDEQTVKALQENVNENTTEADVMANVKQNDNESNITNDEVTEQVAQENRDDTATAEENQKKEDEENIKFSKALSDGDATAMNRPEEKNQDSSEEVGKSEQNEQDESDTRKGLGSPTERTAQDVGTDPYATKEVTPETTDPVSENAPKAKRGRRAK